MKIASLLLAALCFALSGQAAEPAPTPTEAEIEAQATMLQSVAPEFFHLSAGDQPSLTWRTMGPCEQNILPLSSRLLATADFALLRPLVDRPEEYCVVNVCAAKDPDQKPVYLYLFSYKARKAALVAAFHVRDGKAERIKG